MAKIAFVTSEEINDFLEADKRVLPLLRDRGHTVNSAVWSDSSIDWNTFDLVIIRSPWDYFQRPTEYIQWLKMCQRTQVKLLNPAHVVLDNIDKRYLLNFQKRGISIVPTVFVAQNSEKKLHTVLNENNWNEVVIKPIISGGSWDTWRSNQATVTKDEDEFVQQKNKHNLFVQPFLPEIINTGEYSVLYFNGQFSHAVLKQPQNGDYRIQTEFGGHYSEVELNTDILVQTQKIIDLIPEKLLYARVDGIIRDEQFLLMELEINEPDLYFDTVPAAIKHFADAVCEHI